MARKTTPSRASVDKAGRPSPPDRDGDGKPGGSLPGNETAEDAKGAAEDAGQPTGEEAISEVEIDENLAALGIHEDEEDEHPNDEDYENKRQRDEAYAEEEAAKPTHASQFIQQEVSKAILHYATKAPEGMSIVRAGTNLQDTLGVHRSDLASLGSDVSKRLDIVISESEAENFLFARDIFNTVKRKLLGRAIGEFE